MGQDTKPITRPSWDEYFLELAAVVAKRGSCLRPPQVGAVIVSDKRIIATGYNGTPTGIDNCDQGGCARCMARHEGEVVSGQNKDACICIHAEQNAIIQAALYGVSTSGATLYTTHSPCTQCAKMIINSKVVRVVFATTFDKDPYALDVLKRARLDVYAR